MRYSSLKGASLSKHSLLILCVDPVEIVWYTSKCHIQLYDLVVIDGVLLSFEEGSSFLKRKRFEFDTRSIGKQEAGLAGHVVDNQLCPL